MCNHTRLAIYLPATTAAAWCCWMLTLSFLCSAAAAFNASELPPIKPPPYPPNSFADDPFPDLKWVQEAAFFAWQIYDVPIIKGTSPLEANHTLEHNGETRPVKPLLDEGYTFPIFTVKAKDATLSIAVRSETDDRGPPLLLVYIKGSEDLYDWIINFDAIKLSKFGPTDRPIYDSGEWPVNVHNGYNRIFDRPNTLPDWWTDFMNTYVLNNFTNYTLTVNENSTLYDVVEDVVDGFMSIGIFDRVSFTGHSKGGAQAQLMAGYYAVTHPSVKVDVMTMGAPKQGNFAYKLLLEGLDNLRMFRFVYGFDLGARVPTPGMTSENFHHAGHLIWNRYPLNTLCGAESVVEAYYRGGENLPPDSDYATVPEDYFDASLDQIGDFLGDHFLYDTWLLGAKRFVWPYGPEWEYTGNNYPRDYVRSGGIGADDGKYPFPRICKPAGIIVENGTRGTFYYFIFAALAIAGLIVCTCVIVVIIRRKARENALREETSQRRSDTTAEKKELGQEPEEQSAKGPTTAEDEEIGPSAHDHESKQTEAQPTTILPTGELLSGSIENKVNYDEGEA